MGALPGLLNKLPIFCKFCYSVLVRREYLLKIEINGRMLKRVIIDAHYEVKHSRSVNDPLVLELVKTLNGTESQPKKVTSEGFEIFVDDPVFFGLKAYRMIWTLHPDENYIGIINVFRR
jgi:hypothetical protein